ncbi:neprilysin-2-like [Stegodyphus dumicola]|uniref:neprilysin-2-like n=1 Tax=Stegodyphus dumicola TaxID=202533 RepID=UPI0015AB242A|nr:neprilysin-2-like [Stegodyphus dumicola]
MKCIIDLLCWLLLVICLLQTVALPLDNDIGNSALDESSVCMKPTCVKAAADILANLDQTKDPCDDFYQFACGGWIGSHTIPEDKPFVSIIMDVYDGLNNKLRILLEKELTGTEPEFIRLPKDMYASCMNVERINNASSKPLKNALRDLGGWPVLEGENWNSASFDWLDTLINLRRKGFSHKTLMSLDVAEDMRNNTVHIIGLDQPSLGMPDRKNFLAGLNDSLTAAYFQLMVKAAKQLGADESTSENELREVLNFETMLANFSLPLEERRNFTSLYNKYTVKELNEKFPQINWLKYFNGLLKDQIFENETLVVAVPNFIRKFADLITQTDKRVVANYMLWRVVKESLPNLAEDSRALMHDYESVMSGQSKQKPRWEQCLWSVSGSLGVALSSYYVREHFKEESKQAAVNMVQYIQDEILDILKNIDWMDSETKKHAKEKAEAIVPHIGYPTELLNDSYVADLYKDLRLTNESYFENARKLRIWSTDEMFSRLREPFIKGLWKNYAEVAVVNAYYAPTENTINFPAGILQHPLFNSDQPQYLNFAAIGLVIGHEITHGFDDQGRQFDKDGNNVNWWDDETDRRFKEKAQCIIEQYGNYTVADGIPVNGINTQGENIADLGGIKAAYLAYQTWTKDNGIEPALPGLNYTQNQLFFISAANVWCGKYRPEDLKTSVMYGYHSPDMLRVIGPMSNLQAFSDAFQCPEDSKMVRQNRCQVW